MLSQPTGEVGLGLIGLGWWGGELSTAAENGGVARVVSGFARSDEARARFAEERGVPVAASLDELLGDPAVEGVLIATSHQSHRDLVEQAASAGKHIFVEKPLAITVEDGLACVAAAERAGVLLQVGHQRRRTAASRRMKELLANGDLGDVETVIGQHSLPNGFKMPETAWRWSPEQSPLGSMTSLGIHKIDSMQYLVGRIARVSAFTRAGRSHPIDEATVLAFEFEDGALGTLTTSFFTPLTIELSVMGTLGAAHNTHDGTRLGVQMRVEPEPTQVELAPVDTVVDELVGFANAIRGKGPVEPDGRDGLAVVAVMEAAVASTASGRAVDVASF
jgi:predicted dehydrogenase